MNIDPAFIAIGLGIAAVIFLIATREKKESVKPDAWSIGPVVNGENFSRHMPHSTTGVLDLATPQNEPHYVYRATGPLMGKKFVELVLDVEMEPGSIVPVHDGKPYEGAACVSLLIQRAGDNWRSNGFRFYARTTPLAAGRLVLRAELDVTSWRDMLGVADREKFALTLANPHCIGFCFGGSGGIGHGIMANKPARITVVSFKVE